MPALSQYENAAKAFLTSYPVGTSLFSDELLNWATEHKDGLASDLLIADSKKCLTALRRHLNSGGASRNLPEADRFVIDVIDAKSGAMEVVGFADHGLDEAATSLGKGIRGGLAPFKKTRSTLEAIKKEELPDDKRAAVEQAIRTNIENMEPMKKVLGERLTAHYIQQLVDRGHSPEIAGAMLEMMVMPTLSGYPKLSKYLA